MKFKKFYYKKIKSTNDKALKHISKGYEKGIVLTDTQTKGKGQRGKNWISLKGNLFMTVFFEIKSKINLKKITKINCYIVRDCLQKLTDFKILIKKPNDLLINKKVISKIFKSKNSAVFFYDRTGFNFFFYGHHLQFLSTHWGHDKLQKNQPSQLVALEKCKYC